MSRVPSSLARGQEQHSRLVLMNFPGVQIPQAKDFLLKMKPEFYVPGYEGNFE